MSFFPNMFQSPPKGFRSWLVQVTQLGECVVYSLDEEGKPSSITCGPIDEAFGRALQQMNPRLRIVKNGPRDPSRTPRPERDWHLYPLKEDTWKCLVDTLNKKGVVGARLLARLRELAYAGYEIPQIRCGYRSHPDPPFELTEEGRIADERLSKEGQDT